MQLYGAGKCVENNLIIKHVYKIPVTGYTIFFTWWTHHNTTQNAISI